MNEKLTVRANGTSIENTLVVRSDFDSIVLERELAVTIIDMVPTHDAITYEAVECFED